MIEDAFVFDCVCHVFNFDKSNAFGKPGEMFIDHLYAFHQVLNAPGEKTLSPEEYMRQWHPEEIGRMVFDESPTDMIVAQPLPLTDLFKDGLSSWERCAEMARLYPDRAIFWGRLI
ncbi:MAG: amidohydrolase, partial [Chloroflexus aggregans]